MPPKTIAILRHRPIPPILMLLIPILALGIYLRTFDQPLMRPGRVATELNTSVTGQTPFVWIWTEPTPAHPAALTDYRPMAQTLHWLQWRIWGNSPSSFHAFGLLLFLAAIILYLMLAGRVIHNAGGRATAGLVLALHPMASQSVLGVEAQGLLLALLASLAAALEFLRWRRTRRGLARTAVVVAVCFAVALGAHPMALALPFWLAALAWWGPQERAEEAVPERKTKKKQGGDSEKEISARPLAPGAAAAALALPLIGILAGYTALRYEALGRVVPLRGGYVELVQAPSVLTAYLARLLWPATPTLVYPPETVWLPKAVLGWILIAALAGVMVYAARRWRSLALGLVMMLIPLAGLSHWLPLKFFMSEGALLFALPGLGLVLGAVIEKIAGNDPVFPMVGWRGQALAGVIVIAAAAMAWQTVARTGDWSSEENLWLAEVEIHPSIALPRIELMGTYLRAANSEATLEAGQKARALATTPEEIDRIVEYEARLFLVKKEFEPLRALLEEELASDRPMQPGHLGELAATANVVEGTAMKELAEELWRKQLKIDPNSFSANFNLGVIEFNRNDYDSAVFFSMKAAQNAPKDQRVVAYTQAGEVLMNAEHYDEAIYMFTQTMRLDPGLYIPYVRLAQIYWGRKEYAKVDAQIFAAFSNANVRSYVDLASIYMDTMIERNQTGEAMNWLAQLLQRYPADIELRLLAAQHFLRREDYARARQIYQQTAGLNPKQQAEAMTGMGVIALNTEQDRRKAEELWRGALRLDREQRAAREMLRRIGVDPDAPPSSASVEEPAP